MHGLIQHFSTSAVPPSGRLDYWNRLASESSAGLSIDSGNIDFSGNLQRWTIGDLTLMRARAERSIIRRAAIHSGDERLRVHLQLRGISQQRHIGREALLRGGDISICTSSAAVGIEADRHEMLVLDVGRSALEHRVPDLDRHLGCPTRANSPAAHSFAQFATALWREADSPDFAPDLAWQMDSAEILLDLLGLAVRSAPRGGPAAGHAAIDRILAIVESRICDASLNANMLADELGVSVRTVHLWFAARSTTPRAYILSRRLERAAERLAMEAGLSVTEVAFDLGFNDLSYFTRCFRRTFGVTPSGWRSGVRH